MKVESNANAMVVSGSYQIDWKGTVSSQLAVAERGESVLGGGSEYVDVWQTKYTVYGTHHHRVWRPLSGVQYLVPSMGMEAVLHLKSVQLTFSC